MAPVSFGALVVVVVVVRVGRSRIVDYCSSEEYVSVRCRVQVFANYVEYFDGQIAKEEAMVMVHFPAMMDLQARRSKNYSW